MGPKASNRGTERARCYRYQLPMKIAFGVTHHKSQDATLNRVVLDTGKREINDGKLLLPSAVAVTSKTCSSRTLARSACRPSGTVRHSQRDWLLSIGYDLLRTRRGIGLPTLAREPRPPRPATSTTGRARIVRGRVTGRGRGRGQGRTSGRKRGRGNGRGLAPSRDPGGGGRGPRRKLGRPPMVTKPWETDALYKIERSETDSWFHIPLLLDAFGVQRPLAFERPLHWELFVECYRVEFTR